MNALSIKKEVSQMKIVKFCEIQEELVKNFQRKTLIPVIGSGFTRNCDSIKGKVPSGEDYKKHMVNEVIKKLKLSQEKEDGLLKEPFSRISSVYNRVIPLEERKAYLFDNFTEVQLDDLKKDFLTISWPYIYTLNIDDGIEKNSAYNFVIYANRHVSDSIFAGKKCVIKLHGDVSEMLAYTDAKSEIFTQEQYIKSLKENTSLLDKLSHDMQFHNMVFIGCSLSDEIDIMSCSSTNEVDNTSARYYCTTQEPEVLEQIQLEQYGITHCVLFDTYDEIYDGFFKVSEEAAKIQVDDLTPFQSGEIMHLTSGYDQNKAYLLYGKSLIGKDRKITFPYFFIHRDITGSIFDKVDKSPLQFVLASGCSGSSYIAIDLASRIRDREVFVFESKDRITEDAFSLLLQKQNCVVIADCKSLSNDQIEKLILSRDMLTRNGTHVLVFAAKSNRDLSNTFQLLEYRGVPNLSELQPTQIGKNFSQSELVRLNPLLTAVGVGVFNSEKTIVDNIITVSETLRERNKFYSLMPHFKNIKEIAALIALATEKKLYSTRVILLDTASEIEYQQKATDPLIERESTWSFEKDDVDNSPAKFVLNAEFWLYRKLGEFAKYERNHPKIAQAYKYIVGRIITHEGPPNLDYNKKDATYKEYIIFDNINRIFCSYGYAGTDLIQKIYDSLNDDLSSDPNYMHQRAKCRIKMAYKTEDASLQKKILDQGFRDAGVALQVFEHRYSKQCNEKIAISIAHVMYTRALILCHEANVDDYSNVSTNSEAIRSLYVALKSPYNTYAFAKGDSYNFKNVIKKTILTALVKKEMFTADVYDLAGELFSIISENEKEE